MGGNEAVDEIDKFVKRVKKINTPKEFNNLRKQVTIVSEALKEGIEITG